MPSYNHQKRCICVIDYGDTALSAVADRFLEKVKDYATLIETNQKLFGETLYYFLKSIINTTQIFKNDTFEYLQMDVKSLIKLYLVGSWRL